MCDKSFITKDTLNKHMSVHVEERNFKCGECGKLFKRLSHVREHIKIHSSARAFPCTICEKSFKTNVSTYGDGIHCLLRLFCAGLGGSVGCLINWWSGGYRFDPHWVRQHSFSEIDHEIFFTVILSLSLFQERQLSVSGKRMCAILVNLLEDTAQEKCG